MTTAEPFNEAERVECKRVLLWGLDEDLGRPGAVRSSAAGFEHFGDVTSKAVISAELKGEAIIVARKAGVVAGLQILPILTRMQGFGVEVATLVGDGPVEARAVLARYSGSLRGILAIERLGLNLLGRLSGIATLTAAYVAKVAGTSARIYDTRKTTPGLRRLEKYAVRVGGAQNHRIGLFDAVLIKDNHLAALSRAEKANGSTVEHAAIQAAIEAARQAVPNGFQVEVEVDSLEQFDAALIAGPDVVLLDNMNLEMLREAVARRNVRSPDLKLEASGGVTLETVRSIAETGVDRISVGALTHSAPNFDVALDYIS